jgi:nucleoside-diphosphate-sugar epimerase
MVQGSKRIAVTGGHGKIGEPVVSHLRERGYDVFVIDRDGPLHLTEPMMVADLENFGQTLDALSSVGKDVHARPEQRAFDVVVHLASVPHPRVVRTATSSG